jgi:rapamycin-insensitive companion of mTOR
MSILESHHFRLPVCRFVIDLFDKKVMRQVVLEEEDEEDSDDSEDEGSSESDLDIGLPNGSSHASSA